jgi:two-component system, cell cycle sensor histidine kinase and response regulator CckA
LTAEPGASSSWNPLTAPAGPAPVAPIATQVHKDSPHVTTILLTDDQAGVRAPLRRILEDSGYRVIEAGGGEEALALAGGLDGPIHLLLTDVVMPGMSGGELARRLGESRPNVKVLFMSGFSREAVIANGNVLPGSSFLSKPFTASDLLNRVRETLAASPIPRGLGLPSTRCEGPGASSNHGEDNGIA